MKRLVRLLLLADFKSAIAYPVRVLLFYCVVAFTLPVLLYINLREKLVAVQALEVVKELINYEIIIGITLVMGAFIYAFFVGSDYTRVREFARRVVKGDFNYELELSSIADREAMELYRELLKLRNAIVVSQALLKKRGR